MTEFFNVVTPDEAVAIICTKLSKAESLQANVKDSVGRVLAESVYSSELLPAFTRSTMDGYSVRAQDTFGASDTNPAYLELSGEILMGQDQHTSIAPGEATTCFTGGMLAGGADAVLMIENTSISKTGLIEVFRQVAPGENTIQKGEDYCPGEMIAESGKIIDSHILGSLLSAGITKVDITRNLNIAIFSSGDELVAPEEPLTAGKIRDINLYMINSLIRELGIDTTLFPLLPDDFDVQHKQAKEALTKCDAIVFSAGSSISGRDLTAKVFESLGKPGILVHGLSIKPGKPTILGICDNKPLIGLPGNPVSAVTVFKEVARPIVMHMMGAPMQYIKTVVSCRLASNLSSSSGRTDYVRVQVVLEGEHNTAVPVYGKSNLISTMVNSDGYVVIPSDSDGIYEGDFVDVVID